MNGKFSLALLTHVFLSFSLFAGSEPVLNYKVWKKVNWNSLDGSMHCVQLKTENIPSNTPLNLAFKRLDGRIVGCRVFVDEQNQVTVLDPENKQPYWTFSNFVKGEPLNCLLVSEDRKFQAFTKIIPIPLQSKDENGHVLSLELASIDKETFLMTATGFDPYESVEFCSTSGTEVIKYPLQASSEGKIEMGLAPAVIGEISGNASVEILGKTTNKLKVNYKWGIPIK